jgi:hypothetical protein
MDAGLGEDHLMQRGVQLAVAEAREPVATVAAPRRPRSGRSPHRGRGRRRSESGGARRPRPASARRSGRRRPRARAGREPAAGPGWRSPSAARRLPGSARRSGRSARDRSALARPLRRRWERPRRVSLRFRVRAKGSRPESRSCRCQRRREEIAVRSPTRSSRWSTRSFSSRRLRVVAGPGQVRLAQGSTRDG